MTFSPSIVTDPKNDLIERLRNPYQGGGLPGRGSWENDLMAEAADSIESLVKERDELRAAAKDLFPPKAEIWNSRRLHWVREVLIKLGQDPAPTVPRCTDLDGLSQPTLDSSSEGNQ